MSHSIDRLFSALRSRLREVFAYSRNEAGGALVELALILGIFGSPLLLGTVEVASLLYSSIEISNAAHAGVMYGMMSSTYAADTTGITTAAQQDAADFGSNLTATPSTYYVCSVALAGTQYTTQSAANTACTRQAGRRRKRNGPAGSTRRSQANADATTAAGQCASSCQSGPPAHHRCARSSWTFGTQTRGTQGGNSSTNGG